MTTWTAVEDAIRAWVKGASGLSDGQVIFGEQDGVHPAAPWITISLGDVIGRGVDELRTTAVDTGAKSVTQTASAHGFLPVQLRCYSADATGENTARAILAKVKLALALETYRVPINDAGLGLQRQGTVQALPRVVNAGWESQAILELEFFVVQTASETIPYIAHVNGEGTLEPGDVDLPFTADLP